MKANLPEPRRATSHATEIRRFYDELFANARGGAPADATPPAPAVPAPRGGQEQSLEEFYRELFAKARNGTLEELGAPARPTRSALPRPVNPANPEAISTEEFYRQIFAEARQAGRGQAAADRPQESAPPRPEPQGPESEPQSLEDYYRDLFAQAEGRKPLVLGPREGLEPPALPERFRRVRGGNQLVSYELLVGADGRIAAKHESVAGRETYFIFEYDRTGHLLRAWRDGRLAEEYAYNPRGARVASWNPKQGQWKYGYDQAGRLTTAGPWGFAYGAGGALREAWNPRAAFLLSSDPASNTSRVVFPGNRVLRSVTMALGLPVEKYLDARLVESLSWRSPLQLATYRDHERDLRMEFHYAQGRLPQAVTVRNGEGATTYLLGYDQVGSLKAVAAMDGPNQGRVVKILDYDAFGNIRADSNPSLFLPIAFAGGLRDRLTGLVRFCHRDYDPTVGRFTAPDPMGDTGGDHDLYDYCVDEPVGRVDPEGLEGESAVASGGFLSGIGDWFSDLGKKIGGLFSSDTPTNPGAEAGVLKEMDTASRSVDSALDKAKNTVNSVKPELEDIAKAGGIANKITLPQEAHGAATGLKARSDAFKAYQDRAMHDATHGSLDDRANAALRLQDEVLQETSRFIGGESNKVVKDYFNWFGPIPISANWFSDSPKEEERK